MGSQKGISVNRYRYTTNSQKVSACESLEQPPDKFHARCNANKLDSGIGICHEILAPLRCSNESPSLTSLFHMPIVKKRHMKQTTSHLIMIPNAIRPDWIREVLSWWCDIELAHVSTGGSRNWLLYEFRHSADFPWDDFKAEMLSE